MRGRGHVLLLAGIVVVAAVARALPLREPIRYDEAYSFLNYVVYPVRDLIGAYNLPNNHVLNSVLAHGSVELLGNRLWSLRLPSFIAGVLLVPVAYGAGRALYGARAGLWAAALAAGSAPLIDFAVISRGYSPGLLFVVLALWMAALGRTRWWPWPVFAVSGALAVWSVPTMGPGMAVVGLWAAGVLLWERRFGKLAALAGASVASGLLAYLLYRPTLGQGGWDAGKTVLRDASVMWDLAQGVWGNWNRAVPWPVEVVLGAAFAAGLVLHRRIGRQPLPIAVPTLVVLAASVLTGLGAGAFPRYWLAYLPFVLLTIAAGAALATDALLRSRPKLDLALPGVVAAVLAALVLIAGQRGAEEPPTGDNAISGYLYRDLKAGEVGAARFTFAPAVDYYLYRDRLPLTIGHVTDAMKRTGRAIIAVPGDDEFLVHTTVRFMGGVPGDAKLLRRFDYMSVWEVQILA